MRRAPSINPSPSGRGMGEGRNGDETSTTRRFGGFLIVLILASCSVGPKYRTPTAPVPDTFKELAGWKQAQPQEDVLRENWWELFNDPQLNALEEQVNVSNQTIGIVEAQFRAARATIGVVRSGLFPTVNAGLSVLTSRTSGDSSNRTSYVLPLQLSYEADVWGRIRRIIEAQVASAQASSADIETARLSIHAELAVDYFELRGLDEQQRLLLATVAEYEQALQLTTNRYNQGVVSGVDVAQAQTQLETARAESIDVGVARAQFEHAIATLTGKPPVELSIAIGTLAGEPPAIPIGVPSALLERRPDIAAEERRVAVANAQIGVAMAAFFPTITLSATGGLQSSRVGSLLSFPSRFWSIGPSLAQTVFDAGRRRAITAAAQAIYDSSVATYRQNVLTAFQDVEDNLAALRILAEESAQRDIAVQSAQRSLDLANNRYRGGVANYLEVITAQTALLENQRIAIGIRVRRMIASVLLVKALGGGWSTSELPASRTLVKDSH
jgi:NodT family efflux transporter outer membrane factor (OMF) lipoprotein